MTTAEQHFYFRIHNKNPEPTLCRFRVLVIISVCIELHEKCVRLFHFESYECMRVFIELDFPPCV